MHRSTVPLREYLAALREADLRFDAERDRRLTEVAQERERAIQIKQEADRTALELARQINDLHLAALNGEQARLLADRERFLSREVFDQEQKTFSAWRDTVNSNLSLGTGRATGISATWGVLVAGIATVAAVVGIVLAILK